MIVEGCYIPVNWRQAFDDYYLEQIRFLCLAMSEKYIKNHFDKIIEYESEIETRLVKAACMMNELKQCNRWFIDTFSGAGEKVVIIYSDFDKVLLKVLE